MKTILAVLRGAAQSIRVAIIEFFTLLNDHGQLDTDASGGWPPADANIRELLRRLCGNDDERMMWVMRWLALPLRDPDVRMSTALAVHGDDGCGKTMFFEYIVGNMHHSRSTVIRNLPVPIFNSHLSGMRYVLIDEVISRQDAVWVKTMMTSSQFVVETMGKLPMIERNLMNFVFLSVQTKYLPDFQASQRFMVIKSAPRSDTDFYQAVLREVHNGGVEAFLHFLMYELDMAGFHPDTPRLNDGDGMAKVAS